MPVRNTSVAAFREVQESGFVGRRQKQAYSALYEYGPCTASELFRKMSHGLIGSQSNVATRLGELRAMGVVSEVDERACTITGKKAIVWDVTDRLPIKPAKPDRVKCCYCNGKGYVEQGKLF